ncbi:MAG: MFS transporter [bacterium]
MKKRIFSVLFISVFAAMLGLGIIAPLMPVYARSLGATGIWLGIIFSGYSLSRAVFMPIIGKLSDKKGRKGFITFGLLLYSGISLVYIVAGNVYYLTSVRFIHGLASAMVIPVAMAYVGEIAEKGREGRYMGTFNMALLLGMGAGPFLGGLLNESFGIASVFYAMAGLTAIAFLITLVFLPDMRYSGITKMDDPIPFKEIIKNNVMKGLLLYRIITAMGRGGIMAFLPIFASRIDITSSQVGIIISFHIFLIALLQNPFGRLADRYNKLFLVLIGSSVGALALLITPIARNFWQLFFISSIMGLGGATSMPSASAITVEVGQRLGMGVSMGLFNTAMSAGMIAAPLIAGVVMDILGVKSVFFVAGVISLLGTFVFYHYIRRG